MANTKDMVRNVQKHVGKALDQLTEALSILNDEAPNDADNYSDYLEQLTEMVANALDNTETVEAECAEPVINGGEDNDEDDDEDAEDDEENLVSVL